MKILSLCLVLIAPTVLMAAAHSAKLKTMVIETPQALVKARTLSMTGPIVEKAFSFDLKDGPPWITEFKVENFDGDKKLASNGNICHGGIAKQTFKANYHGPDKAIPQKFVIHPWVSEKPLKFPKGTGLPVTLNESGDYHISFMYQNTGAKDKHLRSKVTIKYMSEKDAIAAGLRPLFSDSIVVLRKLIRDDVKPVKVDSDHTHVHHHGHVQKFAVSDYSTSHYSWMVPAGKHSIRSNAKPFFKFAKNRRLHFAKPHLHPYCTSIRLVDLETNTTVVELSGETRNGELYAVGGVMSEKGILLKKNHSYDIVMDFNNTTGKPIDAMGVIAYFFTHDEADTNVAQNK